MKACGHTPGFNLSKNVLEFCRHPMMVTETMFRSRYYPGCAGATENHNLQVDMSNTVERR
jgi:hypothetical protein